MVCYRSDEPLQDLVRRSTAKVLVDAGVPLVWPAGGPPKDHLKVVAQATRLADSGAPTAPKPLNVPYRPGLGTTRTCGVELRISDLVGSPMVKERELDHLAPTGASAGDGGFVRVGRKGR